MGKIRKRPASVLEAPDDSLPTNGSFPTTTSDTTKPHSVSPEVKGATPVSNDANGIRFGKYLASSDKEVRDRTVASLRDWLRKRSISGSLTDLDLMKIWRGLWYCMFMCDKSPIQRELAMTLVDLIHLFDDDRAEGVRFFRVFCMTMQRDWTTIDGLRIDKYYTLVRFFVREAIYFCRRSPSALRSQGSSGVSESVGEAGNSRNSESTGSSKARRKKKKAMAHVSDGEGIAREDKADAGQEERSEWDIDLLRDVVEAVEKEIVTLTPAPIGLALHLTDLWVEEAFIAGEDMPTEAMLMLVAPWLRAIASKKTNSVVVKRVIRGVFDSLLGYFPSRKGAEGGVPEGGEDGQSEEQAASQEEAGGGKIFKNVDLKVIQACLFEAASAPQTHESRRKQLYQLHKEYQRRTGASPDASAPPSGILPASDEDEDSPEHDEESIDGNESMVMQERPRAVRGPEPPVLGWAAAGIASGEITPDQEPEVNGNESSQKRKKAKKAKGFDKGSGDKEELASVDDGVMKVKAMKSKSDVSGGPSAGVGATGAEDVGEGIGMKSQKKRRRGKDAGGMAEEDGVGNEVEQVKTVAPLGSKKQKRRKGEVNAGGTVTGSDSSIGASDSHKDDDGSTSGVEQEAASSEGMNSECISEGVKDGIVGKAKKKKKKRSPVEKEGVSAVAPSLVPDPAQKSPEAVTASPKTGAKSQGEAHEVEDSSSSSAPAPGEGSVEAAAGKQKGRRKKKKKQKNAEGEESEVAKTVEDSPMPSTEQLPSMAAGAGTATEESPSSPSKTTADKTQDEEAASPASSSASFHTPMKGEAKSAVDDAAASSARKTVTFGKSMAKAHRKSVKDLKTCSITPAKKAGTPHKGLLKAKISMASSESKSARASATPTANGNSKTKGSGPRRRLKATDFF